MSHPTTSIQALQDAARTGTKPHVILLTGIFGELEDCSGVAEEIIETPEQLAKHGLDPAEGGTFMKIVGCSYLYKGYPQEYKVRGMEQAKGNISSIPRLIIGKSIILSAAVATLFVFFRKRFIHYAHIYFNEIKFRTLPHIGMPYERYGYYVKEVARAVRAALNREFRIDPSIPLLDLHPDNMVVGKFLGFLWRRFSHLELPALITKALAFVCVFMDNDSAYSLRTRDALGEMDKERARRSGAREFLRILQILADRESYIGRDVRNKWLFIRRCVRVAFWVSPRARRLAQYFLLELNLDKVRLDDADWYFCLRRNSYNFRGIPLEQRLKELERIDKERGHVYVKIQYVNAPNAPVVATVPTGTPKT